MNAIGTLLRDPINTGLTRWRMAVSIKDSIAVATNSRSMILVTIVSCVRWFVVFVEQCSHFFVFLPPLLGTENQKCVKSQSIGTMAQWPSWTFYNPLQSGFKFPCFFRLCFLKKKCSLIRIRRERDPSTSHPRTTAPSTRHSRDFASTVAYAGRSPASPPWPTHTGSEAYPDRKKQGTHGPVRPGVGLLLKNTCGGSSPSLAGRISVS